MEKHQATMGFDVNIGEFDRSRPAVAHVAPGLRSSS